jgi:hypothetical protein
MRPEDIAAHKIADALQVIADNIGELSVPLLDAFLPRLDPSDVGDYSKLMANKAERMREAAPFEPIPDRQRQALAEEAIDMFSDMRVKEYVEDLLPQTEWEWRHMADEHRSDILRDIHVEEHATEGDPEAAADLRDQLHDWDALSLPDADPAYEGE